MKTILVLICGFILSATSGCVVAEGRHGHREVIEPAVVVPVPVPVPVR